MKGVSRGVIVALALAVIVLPASASGPVGVYGIVERVVFEPSEASPERVQVWGVFVYVNGCGSNSQWAAAAPIECGVTSAMAAANQLIGTSPVARGYLYFKPPEVAAGLAATRADVDLVKREWADLKAVAGTGQAIGFGRWGYMGNFANIRPDAPADGLPLIYESVVYATGHGRGVIADLRVRPASEAPADPATYQTNAGIVKLTEHGSHAAIVARLRSKLP